MTKRSVYMYLKNKYGDALPGTYDGFKSYTLHKGMTLRNHTKPHVLYEVDPGKQLQVDWKENLLIHLRDGTEILFNVFSAILDILENMCLSIPLPKLQKILSDI